MPTADRAKKVIHWKYALLTIIRLRKIGGLVDDEFLEALKITLHPPSDSPAAIPSEIVERIRSHMADEVEVKIRKYHFEYTRNKTKLPLVQGMWNCDFLLKNYERVIQLSEIGGHWVFE